MTNMNKISPDMMKQLIEQQKVWQQQQLQTVRQAIQQTLTNTAPRPSREAIEQIARATRTAPAEPDTHDEWRRLNEEAP